MIEVKHIENSHRVIITDSDFLIDGEFMIGKLEFELNHEEAQELYQKLGEKLK